jgi:hypothetical protein
VGRTDGEDVDGVLTGQETRHIEIVDGHVSENTAATLDVGSGRWSGITGAQFDLQRVTQRAVSEQGTSSIMDVSTTKKNHTQNRSEQKDGIRPF